MRWGILLRDITASLMTLVALGSVAYLGVVRNDEAAKGALITILSAAVMWYLRGRLEGPRTQGR